MCPTSDHLRQDQVTIGPTDQAPGHSEVQAGMQPASGSLK